MNNNRNQKGFHVCLSCFFLEFKKAEKTQQHEHLAETLRAEGLPSVANHCAQALDDDASIDSTDSSVCVRHQEVMKAACIAWSNSSEAVRKAWNLRANFLNKLPVPGRLNEIVGTRKELEARSIDASCLDWRGLAIKMQNSIKSNPRNEKCSWLSVLGRKG